MKPRDILKNDEGNILIYAVFMLGLLALIGGFAIRTTLTEIEMAGNDRYYKRAFHNADNGAWAASKVISIAVNNKGTPGDLTNQRYGMFDYLDTGTNDTATGRTLYRELAGMPGADHDTSPDLDLTILNGETIQIDANRIRAFNVPGSGAEFASGHEGTGAALRGIDYDIRSIGAGPKNARSIVAARFQKLVGVPGGI